MLGSFLFVAQHCLTKLRPQRLPVGRKTRIMRKRNGNKADQVEREGADTSCIQSSGGQNIHLFVILNGSPLYGYGDGFLGER